MKKLLIPLLIILLLLTCSCSKEEEETTQVPVETTEEATTSTPLTVNDMAPPTADTSLPIDITVRVKDIDLDSFEEIEAEDSVFPESTHDKILKSENAQYFFDSNEGRIHTIFFDENGNLFGSASYNTETGFLEFFGDESSTWYYDEEGKLQYYVYTYTFENEYTPPIYTFYDAEGNREFVRTQGGWYTDDLDILSEAEVLAVIEKYSGTIEATAEY